MASLARQPFRAFYSPCVQEPGFMKIKDIIIVWEHHTSQGSRTFDRWQASRLRSDRDPRSVESVHAFVILDNTGFPEISAHFSHIFLTFSDISAHFPYIVRENFVFSAYCFKILVQK